MGFYIPSLLSSILFGVAVELHSGAVLGSAIMLAFFALDDLSERHRGA